MLNCQGTPNKGASHLLLPVREGTREMEGPPTGLTGLYRHGRGGWHAGDPGEDPHTDITHDEWSTANTWVLGHLLTTEELPRSEVDFYIYDHRAWFLPEVWMGEHFGVWFYLQIATSPTWLPVGLYQPAHGDCGASKHKKNKFHTWFP